MTEPSTSVARRRLDVRGEIEAVAWKDGSSGRWTGDITGLYDGWRTGNPTLQQATFPLAHGTLSMALEQKLNDVLPERGPENPLADGVDLTSLDRAVPDPEGTHLLMPFPGTRDVTIVLRVDPAESDGIYAGATGEMIVAAPNHREAGHLIVATPDGDLRMTFLEHWSAGRIDADLTVDGERSTGPWHGATGDLRFELQLYMIGLGKGVYEGAITLLDEEAAATV